MATLAERVTPERGAAYREELRGYFPGASFGDLSDVSGDALRSLEEALAEGGEEGIQKVLTAYPYLVQYALPHSGHQGVWVFPKQMIKPPAGQVARGMIPDYLVASRSSLGYFWHIVELKRSDAQFSNVTGDGFSSPGQKAIAQCCSDLMHFQDFIDTVRTNIRAPELVQPRGAVILIGDSAVENSAQKTCRRNFCGIVPRIDVVSYDRIRDRLNSDLRAFGRLGRSTDEPAAGSI